MCWEDMREDTIRVKKRERESVCVEVSVFKRDREREGVFWEDMREDAKRVKKRERECVCRSKCV